MNIFFIILLTAMSSPLYAKNFAVFFSGEDNEKKAENQFLEEYKIKTDPFVKSDWDTQILYGDESEAKHLVSQAPKLAGKVKTATKQNIFDYLDKMIANGASGDQLMINMNGHGSQSGYFQLSGGDLYYNDPELISRLKKLNEKGLKIAIAMDTCYGGMAIPALKDHACVVTSQTSNSVGYSGPGRMAFAKVLKQPSGNMNDYYLQLLSETTQRNRMVPMTTASFNNDYLARVSTGLFRQDDQYAATPAQTCYGPEAMEKFEAGFKPMLQMLDGANKYKKICKVFGQVNCKKQAVLAAAIKKINVKNLDTKSDELAKLSDERLDQITVCNQVPGSLFGDKFKMTFDLTGIVDMPKDDYPSSWFATLFERRAKGVLIDKESAMVGAVRTVSFRGSICDLGALTSPESINDLANFYAKDSFIAPQQLYKANTVAELAAKFKKMFTKAFAKTLTPEQKAQISENQEMVKKQYVAEKNYLSAFTKHQETLRDMETANINQALAYKFLDEADNVPENDKVGRQKCEDFKLK